jgi:hypothetical protein
LRHHQPHVHRGVLHLFLVLQGGVHRHHVVLALYLDAVARVVVQGDGVLIQPPAELADVLRHLALAAVLGEHHVEPQAPQRLGHGAGVVHRVAQRAGVLVRAVAHHQRHAALGLGQQGAGEYGGKQDGEQGRLPPEGADGAVHWERAGSG